MSDVRSSEVEDIRRGAARVSHLVDSEVGTQYGRELDLAGSGYRHGGHLPTSRSEHGLNPLSRGVLKRFTCSGPVSDAGSMKLTLEGLA